MPASLASLTMYGFLLVAILLTRLLMWMYATGRPHLLLTPIDRQSRWVGVLVVAAPGLAYGIAILIARAHPTGSLVIHGLVPVAYFVGVTLARSAGPPGSAERDFT